MIVHRELHCTSKLCHIFPCGPDSMLLQVFEADEAGEEVALGPMQYREIHGLGGAIVCFDREPSGRIFATLEVPDLPEPSEICAQVQGLEACGGRRIKEGDLLIFRHPAHLSGESLALLEASLEVSISARLGLNKVLVLILGEGIELTEVLRT